MNWIPVVLLWGLVAYFTNAAKYYMDRALEGERLDLVTSGFYAGIAGTIAVVALTITL